MLIRKLYIFDHFGGLAINKIEALTGELNRRLAKLNKESLRAAAEHLFGVASYAHLLALKRGLDRDILIATGLLHDLWSFETGIEQGHAEPGAQLAHEILSGQKPFSKKERNIIVDAIMVHSDKKNIHGPYAEALKDADTLQHYLVEPGKKFPKDKILRIKRAGVELGILKLKINKK